MNPDPNDTPKGIDYRTNLSFFSRSTCEELHSKLTKAERIIRKSTKKDDIKLFLLAKLDNMFYNNPETTSAQFCFTFTKDNGKTLAEGIEAAMQNNTHVHKLLFPYCEFDDEGIKPLASIFTTNKTLTELHLYGTHSRRMPASSFKILADCFNDAPSLRYVYLAGNDLDDADITYLVNNVLSSNQTLQYIYLGSNNISDEGVKKLINVLKSNTSLIHINLSDNPVGHECHINELEKLLRRNRESKYLKIQDISFNILSNVKSYDNEEIPNLQQLIHNYLSILPNYFNDGHLFFIEVSKLEDQINKLKSIIESDLSHGQKMEVENSDREEDDEPVDTLMARVGGP